MSTELTFTVIVRIDQADVDKLNTRAKRQGRAERTGQDRVEDAIANGLLHDSIVKSYEIIGCSTKESHGKDQPT